jgi:hypothetical protein
MNDEPSVKEMAALWNKCLEFVESQRISCAETIHQTDRVIENAYEFIEDVCDIVGYKEYEDDEE